MEGVSIKCIDQLFFEMRQKYVEERERQRRKLEKDGKKLFFVHELCECSEKRKMRLRFPEVEKATTYNPRFALGQLVEEALKQRFKNENDNIYVKELTADNEIYAVSGMVDIIDPETQAPIEIKYQTSLHKSPHEHHILQTKLYLWLLNAKHGEILYVSPEGLKAYAVNEPLTDEEVLALIKDVKAPRWQEWECKYCQYQQFCNKATAKHR